MPTQNTVTVGCVNCGQPVEVPVRSVIDAQQDPEGKALLLSGQLNTAQCPHCGAVNNVGAPILYHDAAKELLVAHVPMQVGLRQQQGQSEEKIVGDLMNELTRSLPKEQFRAYMFNPTRSLTLQGMVDQILEADGITREMMDEQRARVDLVQTLLTAQSPEHLSQLIQEHDEQLDLKFFQTLSAMAQRLMQDGRQDVVQHMAVIQEALLQESTYGQQLAQQQKDQAEVVHEVAAELQEHADHLTRDHLIDFVLKYQDDDQRLQALVGLARGAFDDEFFALFDQRVRQAPAADRDQLQAVRERLQELAAALNEQMEVGVQQAASLLNALLNSPDPQAVIQANLEAIDDVFMQVLVANLQEAERQGDHEAHQRLAQIYQLVVSILQNNMSPELRFVNDLMGAEDDITLQRMLQEGASQYGQSLYEVFDAIEQVLRDQGQMQSLQQLQALRQKFDAVMQA